MSQQQTRHRGIDGLVGKEPIGAVLSVGRKPPGGNGYPIEKDRFHILTALPDPQNIRHPHPRFRPFNEENRAEALPRRRRVLGQLVHRTRDQAFWHQLKAQRLPEHPVHPLDAPACTGDGVNATRYAGVGDDGAPYFNSISCPHDRCEFRSPVMIRGQPGPTPCKPWMRLLFRIVWEKGSLPTTLTQFTSASWYTTKAALGLFNQIDQMAAMVLGDGRDYTLGGFVFSITLTERRNRQLNTRYPVVTFAPEVDPVDFFTNQLETLERVDALMGPAPTPQLPAPPEPVTVEDFTVEDDTRDYRAHQPGLTDG